MEHQELQVSFGIVIFIIVIIMKISKGILNIFLNNLFLNLMTMMTAAEVLVAMVLMMIM